MRFSLSLTYFVTLYFTFLCCFFNTSHRLLSALVVRYSSASTRHHVGVFHFGQSQRHSRMIRLALVARSSGNVRLFRLPAAVQIVHFTHIGHAAVLLVESVGERVFEVGGHRAGALAQRQHCLLHGLSWRACFKVLVYSFSGLHAFRVLFRAPSQLFFLGFSLFCFLRFFLFLVCL